MKSNSRYLQWSGWLLAGCLSFASCGTEEDWTESVPGESGSVKATFGLAVPDVSPRVGRMTAANTQQAGQDFLGMKNMCLYPFTTGVGKPVVENTNFDGQHKPADLGALATDFTGGKGETNTSMKAKLYADVDLPKGTSAFLFYGESLQAGGATQEEKFQHGQINRMILKNGQRVPMTGVEPITKANDVSFELERITTKTMATVNQSAGDPTVVNDFGKDMLALLNGVLTTWNTYIIKTDAEAPSQNMRDAYTKFRNNNAGSAQSVLALLTDTYKTMSDFKTNGSDADKKCAEAVALAIAPLDPEYLNVGNAQLVSIGGGPVIEGEDPNARIHLVYLNNNYNFPRNLGLPDGAAQVAVNGEGNFQFAQSGFDEQVPTKVADFNEYVYPASLYYWANSPVAVSNAEMKSGFTSASSWSDFLNTFDNSGDPAEVTNGTKSVAMIDAINYAVGTLETMVQLGSKPLLDSKGNVVNHPQFKLTGILVGNVRAANWNFTPSTNEKVLTLYDRAMTAPADELLSQDKATTPVYTLLLPTSVANTNNEAQGSVNVALEFENLSESFYGYTEKVIPKNTRFYLIGRLDPLKVSDEEKKKGINQVIKADHKTTVTFTLSENSLKNAYNVVPDLRTTQQKVGMAVDLKWNVGNDFGQVEI